MTTTTAEVEVPRDGRDRPLIIVEGSPKPVAYTRCSNFAKALSDSSGLMDWKVRQVVKGLGMNPALLNPLLAQPGRRGLWLDSELRAVAEHAYEVAGANDSARNGTAIHGLTEWEDLGIPWDRSTPDFAPYLPFVDAYVSLTRDLIQLEAERFVVNDDLMVAGTYDRLTLIPGGLFDQVPDDLVVIGDVKTGKSQAARPHETALQISAYANGAHYDPATGIRTQIHPDLSLKWGLLIHVPSNGDTVGLYLLDIEAAYEAAQLAKAVRAWRNRKVITTLAQIQPSV